MSDSIRQRFWGRPIEDLMTEIGREALICDVKLLNPGMIEAVLHNNEAATGSTNPAAFKKLRELLMMGLIVREKAVEKIGPEDVAQITAAVREHLKGRFGDQLGG